MTARRDLERIDAAVDAELERPAVRDAAKIAECARIEDRARFLEQAKRRVAQGASSHRISAVKTGSIAIRITADHPGLHSSNSHTLHLARARAVAEALIEGRAARVNCCEPYTLVVQPVAAGVAIYAQTQDPGSGWRLTHEDAQRLGQSILSTLDHDHGR